MMMGDVVNDANVLESALAGEGLRWQLLELVQHQLSQLSTTVAFLQIIKMAGKHATQLEYRSLLVQREAKRRAEIGVLLLEHLRYQSAYLGPVRLLKREQRRCKAVIVLAECTLDRRTAFGLIGAPRRPVRNQLSAGWGHRKH